MENKNWVTLKKAQLPKPLPQSYPSRKSFILQHRDKIKVVEKDGMDELNRGKRFYVDQDELTEFCRSLLQE